jgi:hypothetical protein
MRAERRDRSSHERKLSGASGSHVLTSMSAARNSNKKMAHREGWAKDQILFPRQGRHHTGSHHEQQRGASNDAKRNGRIRRVAQ